MDTKSNLIIYSQTIRKMLASGGHDQYGRGLWNINTGIPACADFPWALWCGSERLLSAQIVTY